MELNADKARVPCFGDRSTSDVVVRLRTQEGRDDWLYCHSHILMEKSKYFADRLSENWPTCQILDSRNCVEVYCQESDIDFHVNILRLFYVFLESSGDDLLHDVKNALGVLRVAVELECPQVVTACVNYLEAVPWEETEEEEIIKTIPGMGSQALPILSRLEPVNPLAILGIFQSAMRFATSSPPLNRNSLKSSAQEQLEYMLTEDDDEPLLTADDEIKSEVRECMRRLFARFNNLVESLLCESNEETGKMQLFQSYLSDLGWGYQMLTKLEITREFVISWVDVSAKIVEIVQKADIIAESIKTKAIIIELIAKVLETMAYGSVILPSARRLNALQVWLPFVRKSKPCFDSATSNPDDDESGVTVDADIWSSLESTFVSLILALPSSDQAEILNEWLGNDHIQYPDLSEAFEVWCYRSKVSKRRLAIWEKKDGAASTL